MDQVSYDSAFAAYELAVARAGGQSQYARDMGGTQQAVSKRLKARKLMPAQQVMRAEAAYGVSRHASRPDLYPIESVAPAQDRAA